MKQPNLVCMNVGRRRVYTTNTDKSLTEQSHKKSCDINNIMAKYQKTGLIDHQNKHQGSYGDVTGTQFQDAQNLIADQKTIFNELPSEVRAKFDNDPANYLNLVLTDEGIEELGQMLAPPPEPEEETPQDVSEPPKEAQGES